MLTTVHVAQLLPVRERDVVGEGRVDAAAVAAARRVGTGGVGEAHGQGMSGSVTVMVPHRLLSGTVLLGVLFVMKMLPMWLGEAGLPLEKTSPRKSPLLQVTPPFWLLSFLATSISAKRRVFEVPSVIDANRD